MNLVPLAVFGVLMFLNMPIAIATAIGALAFFFLQQGLPLPIFSQRLISSADSFPLLAIPMFTLAGVIMNHSGISRRLLNLAESIVGHLPGALAQANIVLATLMGFETGSANADCAMQSKLLGANMVKRGYDPPFVAAIIAASAVISPIMPPGLGFVIFGYLANVSVGRLFLAGIVPGFILAAAMMLMVHYIAKKHGYKPSRPRRATPMELGAAFREAAWALTVPFIVILGIRYGLFTPTEAGAVIVVYATVVGAFIYGELKLSSAVEVLTEAGLTTALVMLIICASDALGFYMALEQVPTKTAEFLTSLTTNPLAMLMLINVFLLILGTFFESLAALILLTPILAPVAIAIGIDPVHLGVIIVLNLTIGAITPPVGTLIFIACSVLNVNLRDFTRAAIPFMIIQIVVLFVLTLFPVLVLALPNYLMGVGR